MYGNYNVTITEGTYTINKKAQEKPDVSIDKTNVLMTENAPVITVKNVPAENGAITYESSNTKK